MSGGFWAGLAGGFGTGMTIGEKLNNLGMKSEAANVDGESQTPIASGQEALAAGMDAYQAALDSAGDDPEARARIQQEYRPTLEALSKQSNSPAAMAYSLGVGKSFRQQEKPFSADEVAGQQSADRQAIYSKYGRPDLAREEQLSESSRRQLADDSAIRSTISQATSDAAAEAAQPGSDHAKIYADKIAPRVIQAYLDRGDTKSAKALADFTASQEGQEYARHYGKAMRSISLGDYDAAVPDLVSLYDRMPDGKKVQAKSLGDGNYRVDWIDEATGAVSATKTFSAKDLVERAAIALAPEKMVEFQAQSNERRVREGATVDRQIQLEQMRQEGQDSREDRRDQRLQTRLDAQDRSLSRRLDAMSDRGLTTAQQRTNDAIDAARTQLTGMSQADVLRKTQSTTATGRPNADYDPQLAKAAKLATTRKFGDDPEHDAFVQGRAQTTTQDAQRADVVKRFRADRTMDGYTVGNMTPNGLEVMKSGKLAGYYR